MDCYFGISTVIKVKKVGKCAIFIEIHELDLDLIKSSNKSCYAWRMGRRNRYQQASAGVNFGASVSYTPKLGGMC
jgi:hypothetical protein